MLSEMTAGNTHTSIAEMATDKMTGITEADALAKLIDSLCLMTRTTPEN